MTTWSAYITASSDDARQVSGGTMELTGGYPNTNGSTVWVGFRFLNVTIPAGSTINSAYINLNILAADDPDVDIYGDDVDDAATFTTSSNNISGRSLTTAKVNWTASNIGVYSRKDSPDIKTIIQEIIDRPGWVSGNSIAILFDSLSSSYINYKAYDSGEGATQYAKLTIDYTSTVNVDLDKLSLTATVRPVTVVPGAVARVLDLLVADIAVQPLGVMPGAITTLLDLLGINGLAHSVDVVPGGVTIDLSRIVALLDALQLWPSVAGADIAIELARLPAAIAAKPLLVVPGMAAVDLATLAASLSALPLTVSYQAADLIIQLLRLSIAAASSPLTVAPGEVTVPLALQQATLTQINLLVFMLLGCAMATDRERYTAVAEDWLRFCATADDRTGCA